VIGIHGSKNEVDRNLSQRDTLRADYPNV
jgi:hypothetical protein